MSTGASTDAFLFSTVVFLGVVVVTSPWFCVVGGGGREIGDELEQGGPREEEEVGADRRSDEFAEVEDRRGAYERGKGEGEYTAFNAKLISMLQNGHLVKLAASSRSARQFYAL